MSADILRRAAKTLREHAEGAAYREGRWHVDVAGPVASTTWLGPSHDALTATWPQAAYIALMHPPVALALAVLLDDMADRVESHLYLQGDPDLCPCSEVDGWHPLANTARAILREEQS